MVQGYPQKIVEVQVDGVPSGPPSESGPSSPSGETPVKEGQSLSPCSTQIPEAGQRSGDASRAYIRGADLEQWPAYPPKDLDYPGLYRLIQKLEVLC